MADENKSPEEIKKEELAAEAAFKEGYESDSSMIKQEDDSNPPADAPVADSPPADAPAADSPPADDATPAKDMWDGVPDVIKDQFDALTKKLDNVTNIANAASGRANKIENQYKNQPAQQKAPEVSKPTSQQILEALGDKDKREALRKDWGDFVGALDEIDNRFATTIGDAMDSMRTEMRKEMRKESQGYQSEANIQRNLDIRHPGWETTINEQSFKAWLYEGGPSAAEQAEYEKSLGYAKSLNNNSPTDSAAFYNQANQYYDALLNKYPTWAAERGNLYGEDSGDAALQLLDLHKASSIPAAAQKVQQKATDKAANRQILEDNLTPTRGNGVSPVSPSDADEAQKAFLSGFNS